MGSNVDQGSIVHTAWPTFVLQPQSVEIDVIFDVTELHFASPARIKIVTILTHSLLFLNENIIPKTLEEILNEYTNLILICGCNFCCHKPRKHWDCTKTTNCFILKWRPLLKPHFVSQSTPKPISRTYPIHCPIVYTRFRVTCLTWSQWSGTSFRLLLSCWWELSFNRACVYNQIFKLLASYYLKWIENVRHWKKYEFSVLLMTWWQIKNWIEKIT